MNPDPDSSTAASRLSLDAIIDDPRWTEALGDPEAVARKIVAACLQSDPNWSRSAASLSVLFADDAQLRDLNGQFRAQDKPTNVLSFPSLSPDEGLGDIAIAFETTAREAVEQGKSFQHHAMHLIAHGVLHLLGYDHQDDSEAEVMEDLERGILARFGVSDPYAVSQSGDQDGIGQ
ncbi:MAG: rRNA maturation RNase YbeY [Caulobacterales bacterium]